ncbi:AAA family ATPase [Paremcibacter congregatus]|uniref:AAA family ATPase n=1 Tax=Paremcibacter congregatus TaxID=2043170 RepID=UPI0030EF6998|tara:strand:- start:5818 stop:7224 length:1407 start_codon:yes stop_codon:yes gene_type:complete
MLKQLQIRNFKGWKDTGTIHMAPISLFFGANSSGKSSIGQFLMMLKQTVESPDRKAVFYPGGKNSAVQLGSYQEMVFHRDSRNKISFKYLWSLPNALRIKDPMSGQSYSGNELSFQTEVGLGDKDQRTLALDNLKYEFMEESKVQLSIGMEREPDTKSKYRVDATNYTLKRKQGRVWSPGVPVRFYGFPDEVVAYHQNADFVQELNLRHEKLFRSLCYLGPLRTKAERLYSWTGIEPESVGYAGENTVAAILASRGRKISLGYKRTAKPFEEIIAIKLKEMSLIEEFRVNPISEQRQEYEVKVRTKGSKDWVDLPDVGFGVSQVLPVLVQCFYAPAGSIILMEQPEIHLHPNAQSALADVMIDVINSRENGADRNIQLIIETHSEHFLRRLQRRIAEDTVPKEKVSAYFANISKTPATLEPLQIDIFGNIQNWPENFFGDEMGDIIAQSKAAVKKRMQKSSEKTRESE